MADNNTEEYTFKQAIAQLYDRYVWKSNIDLTCPQCKATNTPTLDFKKSNNAFRADCCECGSYIKFLSQDNVVYGGKK